MQEADQLVKGYLQKNSISEEPEKDPIKNLARQVSESASAKLASMDNEKPGMMESTIRGAAQGATLGAADEITGALETVGSKAMELGTTGKLSFDDLLDQYRKHRDESRQAYAAAKEANPKSYLAGEIGGGIVTAPLLPEMGALKAGALIGGAAGLGSGEADLTKGEIGQAAVETALGAGLGLAGGAVAKGIGSVIEHPEMLKGMAGKSVLQYLKPDKNVILRELGHRGPAMADEEAASYAGGLYSKVVEKYGIGSMKGGPAADLAKIEKSFTTNRKEFDPILDDASEKLSDIIAKRNDITKGKFLPVEGDVEILQKIPEINKIARGILTDIDEAVAAAKLKSVRGSVSGDSGIDSWAAKNKKAIVEALSSGDLSKVNQLKMEFGDAFKKNIWNPDAQTSALGEAQKRVYLTLKDGVEDLASVVNPNSGKQIQSLNAEYGALSELKKAAEKLTAQDYKGSLADTILSKKGMFGVAGVSAATGHPLVAAALTAAGLSEALTGHTIANLGKISAAKALQGAAKGIEAIPKSLSPGETSSKVAALLSSLRGASGKAPMAGSMFAAQEDQKNKDKQVVQAKYAPDADASEFAKNKELESSPKNIRIDTPRQITDDETKDRAFLATPDESDLEVLKNLVPNNGSEANNVVRNFMEMAKKRDPNGRNAMMFHLKQNPAYRSLLQEAQDKYDQQRRRK